MMGRCTTPGCAYIGDLFNGRCYTCCDETERFWIARRHRILNPPEEIEPDEPADDGKPMQ